MDIKNPFRIALKDERHNYSGCRIEKIELTYTEKQLDFSAVSSLQADYIHLGVTALPRDSCSGSVSFCVPGLAGVMNIDPAQIKYIYEEK